MTMEKVTDALRRQFAQPMSFALPKVPSLMGTVSDAEWQARLDLAAVYRLVAHHGWDDLLSTHIAARVPGETAMLVNPYGVLFEQINASCLVKVDLETLQPIQTSPFLLNPAAIQFHGNVLRARPDAAASVHLHTTAGVAVATHEKGVMPLNQRALFLLPMLGYHDYGGLGTNEDEGPELAKSLGEKWLLIMRNHGTLAIGRTIAQAWVYIYLLERVCQYQVATLAGGQSLTPLPQEIIDLVPRQAAHTQFMGAYEWPALLAKLDRLDPSFRH
jgi:ribulose-5-phosphate 4-epimerase/fuculose-1-phosphate aldolase